MVCACSPFALRTANNIMSFTNRNGQCLFSKLRTRLFTSNDPEKIIISMQEDLIIMLVRPIFII